MARFFTRLFEKIGERSGEVSARIRSTYGLSKSALAKMLGRDSSTITQIEKKPGEKGYRKGENLGPELLKIERELAAGKKVVEIKAEPPQRTTKRGELAKVRQAKGKPAAPPKPPEPAKPKAPPKEAVTGDGELLFVELDQPTNAQLEKYLERLAEQGDRVKIDLKYEGWSARYSGPGAHLSGGILFNERGIDPEALLEDARRLGSVRAALEKYTENILKPDGHGKLTTVSFIVT